MEMEPEKRELKDEYDALIIGAGIGGLTCGALLAKNGLKTLVVEQHSKPGGYVTSYKREGFVFDVPHVIAGCAKGAPIERIMSHLGLNIEFVCCEPFQKFIYPDHTVRVYTNIERYKEELKRAFPAEKENIDRYFQTLQRLWDDVTGTLPYRPRPWDWVRARLKCPTTTKYDGKTFKDLLDDHFTNHQLKAMLGSPWEYLGLPSSRISATYMAIMLMSFHKGGAWYPKGGYQVMARGFAEGLQRQGGSLALRTAVAKILVENGVAMGVELSDGHRIKAKRVISNADTKLTFLKLLGEEHLPKKFAARIRSLEMSVSGFVVHLGVDMSLDQLDSDYIFYYPDYETPEKLFQSGLKGEAILDPAAVGLLVSVATLRAPDSGLAPAGQHCLDLQYMPAPYRYKNNWMAGPDKTRGEEYKKLKRDFAKALIAAAERLIPDLSKHILAQDIATPLTYERYTLSSEGAWYDAACTPRQIGWHRLSAKTPVPGLYLTGAGTYPGPGMFGAIVSGSLTADAILEGALTQGKFALSI